MNSLFVETSAKTSVGVKEAFQEVVEKIMDTPELWDMVGAKGQTTQSGGGGVPGGVQLVGLNEDHKDAAGGCAC